MTAAAATIALPFYLGLIHAALPQLVLYTGVAGAAIATGEFAEAPHPSGGGLRLFLMDAAVWIAVAAFFGGAAYLFALLF